MENMTAGITFQTRGADIYYTLTWSALAKADKYSVSSKVPAVSGIYELYRMDAEKKLNLLTVTYAWYGGLRSQIREAIDPDATTDPLKKAVLTDAELYYRYAPGDKLDALLDVVWFLHTSYFPDDVRVQNSGRYADIFLRERAPDRVHWME